MTEAEQFMAKVRARCVDDGGCHIWQGAVSECGLPRYAHTSVRREMWRTIHGKVAPRLMVSCTCNEKLCVNPEHLCLRTRAIISRETARDGAVRQKRARAMAPIARAKGKLTPAAVAEIRQSGETLKVLGERFGVHFSLISKVRRGEAWRDFSSPFSGLGARP